MAREDGNGSGGNTVLGFGVGLVVGVVAGVGVGLLLATEEGHAWRRDLGARARRLKDETADQYRRAGDVAGGWTSRGKDVAGRLQTAAVEGLREARRHAAAPRDPRSADLAGVEGSADQV